MRHPCIDSLLLLLVASTSMADDVWQRHASETLTALEMNHGDTLKFTLRNGETRTMLLEDTRAEILEKNDGGIVYLFDCRVRIDGHPLILRRYVCTQESFYEPYVVNGLRIWPDSILAIYEQVPMRYPREGNLRYRPRRHARFAVQDATLPICPQPMQKWYPNDTGMIDVGDCYNGDDCWMGPYLGQACHGGLDINHAPGEPLWAPIDFDDQWNFNSLEAGHNNNRWRGIRRWPNGDAWALQTHHHIRLTVPEHTPLRAGTHYADAAGVHVGSHHHTHFEFKVAHQPKDWPIDFDDATEQPTEGQPEVIHLDPWILLWQIFEADRARQGRLSAMMKPLHPGRTGRSVTFEAAGAGRDDSSGNRHYLWTFGDGGAGHGARVQHTFARPGLYAVTLTVHDGTAIDHSTQLMTVDGKPIGTPALGLAAPEEPSFRTRAPEVLDVYGQAPRHIPHTLEFTARHSRPMPDARIVQITNLGAGILPPAKVRILDRDARDWLAVEVRGSANAQSLSLQPNAQDLAPGTYVTYVEVDTPDAFNSPQRFRVCLMIPTEPPRERTIVDNRDAGCYATPYFWVGHRFSRCSRRGFDDFYLTNGNRTNNGQFVRFTPDLADGTYEVAFRPETPFREDTILALRIHTASGDRTLTIRPAENRILGTFAFHEGTDGFVEIHAQGSTGLVMIDAVEFRRIGP